VLEYERPSGTSSLREVLSRVLAEAAFFIGFPLTIVLLLEIAGRLASLLGINTGWGRILCLAVLCGLPIVALIGLCRLAFRDRT
jgi:hypothetical protein